MHALRIHPGYMAAALAFAVDGLYLALIAQQGNGGGSRVAFVAASIAAAGVAAAAAEGIEGHGAGLAAAWATATLWIWVVLALSIGILIVPAGIFATIALTRRRAHPLVIAAGIALALLIAAAGLVGTPD
jgi:uncharacterized membrane protein YhaH (DUF805 family)